MKHILYTEEQGGDFHHLKFDTDEATIKKYEEVVNSGMLIHQVGMKLIRIKPAYISLVEVEREYDFVTAPPKEGGEGHA